MTTRMHRRQAVGAVTCNRWPIHFLHLSTPYTHSHRNGLCPHPRHRNKMHILSHSRLPAHTCHIHSTHYNNRIAHATSTHISPFFFPPRLYALHPLIYQSRPSSFFYYYRLAFSLFFSVDSFCAFNVLICHFSPRLDFGPITLFFTCARAGRPFFPSPCHRYRIFGSCGRDNCRGARGARQCQSASFEVLSSLSTLTPRARCVPKDFR
jgi:hypothetical protein